MTIEDFTSEQRTALTIFGEFLRDSDPMSVMILRGSAGTGKTTLAAYIVDTLWSHRHKLMLLAPTGRAAKVLEQYSGHKAFTIHRRIYRQKSIEGAYGVFNLADNIYSHTLFIIDEASMIADESDMEGTFGSGSLLEDLLRYVYHGDNCRMLVIGDTAQLPPVGSIESPALSSETLRAYGMNVYEADLNEVVRQAGSSGILYNATLIRNMITRDGITGLPKVTLKGFPDVVVVKGDELIETLAGSYSKVGLDETIVVTRSNKRANIYNQGIRNMILGREEELCGGDLLMIVKNNYFWTKDKDSELTFLANGDRCEVRKVRRVRDLYGLRFADVIVRLPDYNDYELDATAMLTTLTTEAPALTREQHEQLYLAIMEECEGKTKRERAQRLKDDQHYNALQVKFAYAVTCHKAQGGQWAHVYVDQGYMTDDMLTEEYVHWLYTAFTRATEKLYLVNWPKTQLVEPVDD